MSINISSVTKVYGEQKALDNVSLEVGKGEILGFLGPNGAGKSTLMKIITGYIPPTAGKIEVAGFDVVENPLEVKKRVGYLPEHNPLYLDMYVREYLQFVGGIYQLKNLNARVDEVIDLVGLGLEQNKKISALSKGYRQRVGLAQALIHDPEVLILDEPTTGLDPNQIVEIREVIKNAGKDKTIMMSTHIMQEVEAICDRVIIINRGVLKLDGDTTEVVKETIKANELILELNESVDRSILKAINGVMEVSELENDHTFRIVYQQEVDIRPLVFKKMVELDKVILAQTQKEIHLEQVFQEVTKK